MSKVEVTVKPFEQDFVPIEMTIKLLDKDSAIAFWQRMNARYSQVLNAVYGSRFSGEYEHCAEDSLDLFIAIDNALMERDITED